MKTKKEKIYTLDPEALITSFVNLDPSGAAKSMADLCFQKGKETGKFEVIKQVMEIATYLNTKFRKNNTYVRVSADEFNDIWEEELKSKLGELAKEQSSGETK